MNEPPQLARLTWLIPKMMNSRTINTLIITMTLLTRADSWMPITRRAVTAAMIIMAGILMMPWTWGKPSQAIPYFWKMSARSELSSIQPAVICSFSAAQLGTRIMTLPGEAVYWVGRWM